MNLYPVSITRQVADGRQVLDELSGRVEAIPGLLSALRAIVFEPHGTPNERLRQARALLNGHASRTEPINEPSSPVDPRAARRGGLAPWQIRSIKDFVEQTLAERLTGADLAKRVRLSEHHFCRAFKVSLQQTPHAYVIQRRIHRAREMMICGPWSIGKIAVECGFSDQAHLNRCFRKLFGMSPGVWRRRQAAEPARDNA